MKYYSLKCPECEASLEIEDGLSAFFCKYCGTKIYVDDEHKEITINKNIHKTVDINRTNRYIDETEIEREKYRDKQERRNLIYYFVPVLIFIALGLCMFLPGKIAISRGQISAGFYRDLIGQDYKTVVAHFEAAGFENIEVIDLDDAGILFWKKGKVEQISIAGDTSFESTDYFSPEATVVISHHYRYKK